MGGPDHRRWRTRLRSIETTRLIVYPAVGLLALGGVAVRANWFGTSSAASSDTTVLRGETAQGQPISVTVDKRGDILSLQTRFVGVCRNGTSYPVSWSPDSPRVPFVRTSVGIVADEVSRQNLSGGVVSTIVAATTAHVQRGKTSGDAGYSGTFRYRNGGRQACSSGDVHWTAYAPGRARNAAPARNFSLGAWAGYLWKGRVRSVSASWRVPHILLGSNVGIAATWIGAQGGPIGLGPTLAEAVPPFNTFQRTRVGLRVPFIQVGLIEVRQWMVKPGVHRAFSSYFAFWTDPRHGNHAIPLFSVKPADEIAARLTLQARRWQVSIRDLTSGRKSVFSTREEAGASFQYAEWLQENPFSPPFGTDEYLYPNLSTVRMGNLEVNGSPPDSSDVQPDWMSAGDGYFAPTPLVSDAFSVHPATISPAGVRYLTLATRLNSATASLVAGSAAATAHRRTSAAARRRAVTSYESALGSLRTTHWPAAVRPLAAQLAANLVRLIAATQPSGAAGGPRGTQLGWAWIAALRACSQPGQAMRRVLGLPRRNYPAQ